MTILFNGSKKELEEMVGEEFIYMKRSRPLFESSSNSLEQAYNYFANKAEEIGADAIVNMTNSLRYGTGFNEIYLTGQPVVYKN